MARKLRVFLCHASEDKPAVRKLYKRLAAESWIEPWLDEINLIPGQDWDLEIKNASRKADAIIICLSKVSVAKEGYVNKEIRRALDISQEKPEGVIYVIPLRLDDCKPSFEQLKKYQWLDYFTTNAHEILLKALRLRAQSIKINPAVQKPQKTSKKYLPLNRKMLWGVVGVTALLSLFYFFSLNSVQGRLFSTPTRTESPTPASKLIPKTSTPTRTKTPPTSTLTMTATPGIRSTMVSEKDGMVLVYVPQGSFTMGYFGSDQGDERPEHQVTLDAYWIDQTEVTNAMYAKCVADKKCDPPESIKSSTRKEYFGNPDFANYPVIYVSWEDAKKYCEWAGRDLPTEAQWEKAARGPDGRLYPWGNTQPKNTLLNYLGSGLKDTSKVGSYPDGASMYGALDMAGNVYEWVNDWYSSVYYQSSPLENPLGPVSGTFRVARGGAWGYSDEYARSSYRNRYTQDRAFFSYGFRCALSISK